MATFGCARNARGEKRMKRLLIKAKKFMSAQERLHTILNIQQMQKEGIVILDDMFEIIPEPNTWYKTSEANPTSFEDVIFCDDKGEMYLGTMDALKRFVDKTGMSIENVVAWMPAPEPYEED